MYLVYNKKKKFNKKLQNEFSKYNSYVDIRLLTKIYQ